MGLNRTRKLLAVMLKWLIIANSLLFNVFECLFTLSDLPGLYTPGEAASRRETRNGAEPHC